MTKEESKSVDSATVSKTPEYFDSIASHFEFLLNPYDLAARLKWFEKQLNRLDIEGKTVLDVGCGLGHFSELVLDKGGYAVSLDLARKLLARIQGEKVLRVQANALWLPFADHAFPLVLSSECAEHTEDPVRAIQEMIRVLVPGGFLVLSTPNRFWKWSVVTAEWLHLRKLAGLENWLSRAQVRRVLFDNGMEIVADAGLHLLPFQLRSLWPLLSWFDKRGQVLRLFMINQCWVARKVS